MGVLIPRILFRFSPFIMVGIFAKGGTAKSLAVKTDKQGNSVQVIDTALAEKYREVLVDRKKEIARLEASIRE